MIRSFLFLIIGPSLFSQTFYLLEGDIAGKYPVKMLLCKDGEMLSGSYYYRKTGKLISLEGFVRDNSQAEFFEFEIAGSPTGQFYGSLTPGGFSGKWLNLNTRKELSVKLRPSSESDDEFWKPSLSFEFEKQQPPLTGFSLPVFSYDGNFAVHKKIEQLFDFKRLTGETWQEVVKKFSEEEFPFGIVGMSGTVTCNQNYILSTVVSLEGRGAHGSYWDERINVNLRRASVLRIEDLLDLDKVGPLIQECRTIMDSRLETTAVTMEENGLDLHDYVSGDSFRLEDLSSFSLLGNDGIAFCVKWEFPYFAKAFEPDRIIVVSFEDLAPYVRSGGLLEAFY